VPTAPAVILALADHLGTHGLDRVLIGINDTGEHVVWHRDVTPHLRITGDTGKGKSVAANTVIAHAIHHGDIITHLDPKAGGAGWVASYAHTANTPMGHHGALAWAVAEMRARQAICLGHQNRDGTFGVPDIYHLPRPMPRVVLVVEEMGAIVGEMAALPCDFEETEKEAQKRVLQNVTRLTLLITQGRSAGMHVIGVTQYPTVEATFTGLTKMGGAITGQFNARIHLDANDISLRAVFNKGGGISDSALRYLRAGRRGRGGYLHLDPGDGERVRILQVWDIDRAALAELATTAARPDPSGYITPMPGRSFDATVREYGP
jgi:hypothetical protein